MSNIHECQDSDIGRRARSGEVVWLFAILTLTFKEELYEKDLVSEITCAGLFRTLPYALCVHLSVEKLKTV